MTSPAQCAARQIGPQQLTLESWTPPPSKRFGASYAPKLDESRLNDQEQTVWAVIKDGHWWTLAGISALSGAPEASVSARLRDIRRKLKEAGLGTVERQRVEGGSGLHEYRLARP